MLDWSLSLGLQSSKIMSYLVCDAPIFLPNVVGGFRSLHIAEAFMNVRCEFQIALYIVRYRLGRAFIRAITV